MDRREFLHNSAMLGTVLTVGPKVWANATQQLRGDWFRKSPRVFLLDFQMPDPLDQGVPGMPKVLQNLDTEKIVDQLRAANVNTLLTHAFCNQGNAYFNTKVGHKHSAIGDRDLMAEFSQLCRARGMTLLFYVQMSRQRRPHTSHPEYQARDAQNRPVVRVDDRPLLPSPQLWHVVCLNGPYRDFIKEILKELSSGYDFDGFWLDNPNAWMSLNPCYCQSCRAAYRRDTGRELPTGSLTSKEGRAYFKWKRALNTKIIHEIVNHIRSVNPKLTVTNNGSALRRWHDWDLCDLNDYVCKEHHYPAGSADASLSSRKNWAVKPGNPFEIEVWRFALQFGYPNTLSRAYQIRSTDMLLMEMAAVVANGGFAQYYDQINPDGTLEPRSLEVLKPAFEAVKARQRWGGKGKPLPYALILWSKATDAYAPWESRNLHSDGLGGVHHALLEKHIPVGIISERDAARKQSRGARVIVAASAECLPADCLAGLKAFVKAGGGLVVTGRSSLRNEDGDLLKNFAVSELLGLDYIGMTEKWYSLVNLEKQHPVTEDLALNFPMTVYETLQTKVRARSGVSTLGTIVKPMVGHHMGFPPMDKTEIPALTIHRFGKGRVVYAGSALGALYKRYNHQDTRRLIANAVLWAAGAAPGICARAPETVEVIPWRDKDNKQSIIHLVNRTGAGIAKNNASLMHDAIPIHDVVLRVSRDLAGKTVTAQPGNRPLKSRWEGDTMVINVERINTWEVVVIA